MSFTQNAVDCRDHPDCTAIVCTDAEGRMVWVSHQEADIDPAERINPDVPAQDKRGQQSIHAKGKSLKPKAST